METFLLQTKLYIPPIRSTQVSRQRLIERLNLGPGADEGHFARELTLISAPAGFGKTTLVSAWLAACQWPAAWLSLDEGDNDPFRFLAYIVAALQSLAAGNIGQAVLDALQSPQPPPIETLLTALLNAITTIPEDFILVLDDYHVIDASAVDQSLTFLLEHLPPQMHLVIATREDPRLPLARLRVRGQLTELRAADLRFTSSETAEFLNQAMGLGLTMEDIAALETRTEGWIAGLQLAALALQGAHSRQGPEDVSAFIQSFTGSHHFVLDYLVEEVLHQQPASIQEFLLCTSILDRLCGSLCDAVRFGDEDTSLGDSQTILEMLERSNLFVVPLDNERRWYRYHQLFADFLRQRMRQNRFSTTNDPAAASVAELHVRASQWYEDQELNLEAFHHAASAQDIARAVRLIESPGMPLHFRGTVTAILEWLASLPKTVMDANPLLWVRLATLSLLSGQTTNVEERLQAAEAALQGTEVDAVNRDLIGQIAAARATLALTQYQSEVILVQSRRALEYLFPDNLPFRFTALWALAFAYQLQGDRIATGQALKEALTISQASGDVFSMILAASGLGQIQELENQLFAAAETYRRILPLFGDHPQPNAAEVYLGLARIRYEWNDLDIAEQYGRQSLRLAQQYDRMIDRFVISEVFLARLKLAQGDLPAASQLLTEAEQSARQHNFVHRLPEIVSAQVRLLLHQGDLAAAARLAESHELLLSRARVYLVQGDPVAALALLVSLRQQLEAKGWQDERLRVMVLESLALQACGEIDQALSLLDTVLALAEPGGFIRLFVDEGAPLAHLLVEAVTRGIAPNYARRILAAFPDFATTPTVPSEARTLISDMIEPLSPRELEVLHLIAQGLSNREIAERLYLALDTVKGHNRRIYGKLHVHRRTEAIARARELGLL